MTRMQDQLRRERESFQQQIRCLGQKMRIKESIALSNLLVAGELRSL
jgi:hypothetical protein